MNHNGQALREKMLGTFGTMLRPARMIMNFSREQLAEFSGLPLDVIAGAEDGIHRLHEPHYLALAAVFDSTKYTEDASIYKALVRILTPENEFSYDNREGDFLLVKRWFATFSINDGEEEEYGHDEYYDDDGDMPAESDLEDIASGYRIFADTSAVEDENFPAFVEHIEPLLRQNDSVISLPSAVLEELRADIDMNDDEILRRSLDCVTRKISEGLIKLRTSPVLNADDTDEILAEMFSEMDEGKRIVLITQDEERADYFTSGNANLTASRLTYGGGLCVWE